MTYEINHHLQFKDDDGVTIITDWNTRRIYVDKYGRHNNVKTVVALCKYNLYQQAVLCREYALTALDGLQAAAYNLSPVTNWYRLMHLLRRKTAWLRGMRDVHRMQRFSV